MLDRMKNTLKDSVTTAIDGAKQVTVDVAAQARQQAGAAHEAVSAFAQLSRQEVAERLDSATEAAVGAGTDKAILALKTIVARLKADPTLRSSDSATIETRVHLGAIEIAVSLNVRLA